MASIIRNESVAFLPLVLGNCCMGVSEYSASTSFHLPIWLLVQSPYMRR